jgi:hypothetical protein
MTRQGRARLALLLGAGCIAAAGSLAAALLVPPERAGRGAPPAENASLELASLALPPLDAFPETTRRPLFSTTRSPASAAAPPAGQEGLILGRYALVGTVVTRKQRLLLLRPAAGGAVLRLKEGDALESWRIERISADALTLSDGGKTEVVALRKAPK